MDITISLFISTMAVLTSKGLPYERLADEITPCGIGRRLRDKWEFADRWTNNFIRIRRHMLIYRDREEGVKYRYQCIDRRGNIYLLVSKSHPEVGDRGVLCLGFSYVGLGDQVEYVILRLNSNYDKFNLISPNVIPINGSVSIERDCDLLQNQKIRKIYAFIKRVGPGCRFPRVLRASWQCTNMFSMMMVFNKMSLTYMLTSGKNITMTCEKRDASIFLLRSKNYEKSSKDVILCVRIEAVNDRSDYAFKFLRLNSGSVFHGNFKVVSPHQQVYIHQICDWIDSPARPEYLYT